MAEPVSTESGIPDFRSADGLYRQSYAYPPETMLSHAFFQQHPEEFFILYRAKMLCPQAKPNQAHLTLARLEELGKLKTAITQNIDGLHQTAGSLIDYYQGDKLVLINKSHTSADSQADLVFHEPIREVLGRVVG